MSDFVSWGLRTLLYWQMMAEQTTAHDGNSMQAQTTGVILCGGRGTRIGGADKPLLPWGSGRLIDSVVDRLRGQVGHLVVSANRNQASYAAIDGVDQVVSDALPDYQGPLAGLAACLAHCTTPWILVCPGDAPDLPADLLSTLWPSRSVGSNCVVDDSERQQNLHFLTHHSIAGALEDYLQSGQRSAHAFHQQVGARQVRLERPGAFRNHNLGADEDASS